MPVFTAAAIAVAAAVATTTVATVVTAVVAVSLAVATVGAALSVVAAITGDKTLGEVGKYMGYAGAVGGLAGAGVGALAEGGTLGASAAEGFSQEGFQNYSQTLDKAWTQSAVNPSNLFGLDANSTTATGNAANVAKVGDPVQEAITGTPKTVADTAPLNTGQSTAQSADAAAPGMTAPAAQSPQAPPVDTPAPLGTQAPATPTTPTTGGLPADVGKAFVDQAAKLPTDTNSFSDWFAKQSDFTKHALLTGGSMALQGIGGGVGAMYTASTAEQRLAFDKQIEAARQAQFAFLNKGSATAGGQFGFVQNRPVAPAGLVTPVV